MRAGPTSSLVVLPQKPAAKLFLTCFTSYCFLKIASHEIPSPATLFHGTRASGCTAVL